MIVKKFVSALHDDMGHAGWLPLWTKDPYMTPVSGFGVAHDVFEHVADNLGGAEGELKAAGGILYLRIEGGGRYWGNPANRQTDTEYMAGIILETLLNVLDHRLEGQTLRMPPPVRTLEDIGLEYYEPDIRAAAEYAVEEAEKECDYDIFCEYSREYVKEAVYRYVVKGCRETYRYYARHGLDAYTVAYLFGQVAEYAEKHEPDPDYLGRQVLRIRVNLRQAEVCCRVYEN